MRLVIECLRCERACRDMAAELKNPNDKRALELMAAGWARRAAERLRKIEDEAAPSIVPLAPLELPAKASCSTAGRTPQPPRIRLITN
jgi:hypothetical protein